MIHQVEKVLKEDMLSLYNQNPKVLNILNPSFPNSLVPLLSLNNPLSSDLQDSRFVPSSQKTQLQSIVCPFPRNISHAFEAIGCSVVV